MLYTHAAIITVDSDRRIIEDGAIYVQGNAIQDLGKTNILLVKYPHDQQYDLSGRIVIPGLISTHMHTVQALIRGTADNKELHSWLDYRIRPLQHAMTSEDAYVSVQLSIAEMLKSGTTCFLESMFLSQHNFDGLCQVVQESGIRGCLGQFAPNPAKESNMPDNSIPDVVEAWRKWNGAANDRIRVWFGVASAGLAPHSQMKELASVALSYGIPITMHCAETRKQFEYFASLEHSPVSWADVTGLLSPSTVLVHMVHLDKDKDIPRLAESGTHIAHCPTSNAKLASGISPVPELPAGGVNVSLGTDGAPCNNSCDMLQEIRLAVIIHRSVSYDPALVPAETALEMATINGARALGLEDLVGSLEIGKKADFVAINTEKSQLQPYLNPVSDVVYVATGRDVDVVVVDGQLLVENGELLTMSEHQILNEAKRKGSEVIQRAGLEEQIKSPWPVLRKRTFASYPADPSRLVSMMAEDHLQSLWRLMKRYSIRFRLPGEDRPALHVDTFNNIKTLGSYSFDTYSAGVSIRSSNEPWKQQIKFRAEWLNQRAQSFPKCRARIWQSEIQATLNNPQTEHAEELDRRRRQRKSCECPQEFVVYDELVRSQLPKQAPDCVVGLQNTKNFDTLLSSPVRPEIARDEDDTVSDILQSETSPNGFDAIQVQSAFPINALLQLQEGLRSYVNCSSGENSFEPLVWFLGFRGDAWRIYASHLVRGADGKPTQYVSQVLVRYFVPHKSLLPSFLEVIGGRQNNANSTEKAARHIINFVAQFNDVLVINENDLHLLEILWTDTSHSVPEGGEAEDFYALIECSWYITPSWEITRQLSCFAISKAAFRALKTYANFSVRRKGIENLDQAERRCSQRVLQDCVECLRTGSPWTFIMKYLKRNLWKPKRYTKVPRNEMRAALREGYTKKEVLAMRNEGPPKHGDMSWKRNSMQHTRIIDEEHHAHDRCPRCRQSPQTNISPFAHGYLDTRIQPFLSGYGTVLVVAMDTAARPPDDACVFALRPIDELNDNAALSIMIEDLMQANLVYHTLKCGPTDIQPGYEEGSLASCFVIDTSAEMTTLIPREHYSKEELDQLYPRDLKLQLVQVFLRHGERTPVSSRFQNVLQHGELTDKGRETTFALGQRLRHLYVDQLGFMPQIKTDTEDMYLRTTPIPRALESLQQAFWGMYPPGARTQDFPAPVIVARSVSEETLFPNEGNCRRFRQLAKLFADRAALRWNDTDEMNYINSLLSKWMPESSPKVAVDSHPRLSGIADTINASLAHGPATRLPSEFYDKKSRQHLNTIAVDEWFAGYTESNEYRKLGIGGLMGDVVDRMVSTAVDGGWRSETSASGSSTEHGKAIKFAMSGCHDTTLAAILGSTGAFDGIWPPFTSSIAIELFSKAKQGSGDNAGVVLEEFSSPSIATKKPGFFSFLGGGSSSNNNTPPPPSDMARAPLSSFPDSARQTMKQHYIRIRYNDRPVRIPGCAAKPQNHLPGDDTFCTLDAFKEIVDKFTPKNWSSECVQNLGQGLYGKDEKEKIQAGF
ncbi:putative acid phosphatase [Aspergillus affinis]|uniref:putative acid phosphatase n=1 Tax=Aspergillus affinis TaxID=1070780 RepID=UPI0022FE42FC|nr:histidine acid phosphatase [Aspergillus affinis]KAI9044025.1 histidine acid phosphatase [Aspergillus affinis]